MRFGGDVSASERFDALIIGGGYVGLTLAVLAARRGKSVVLAERDETRAQAIASARPPFYEPGIAEALEELGPDRLWTVTTTPETLPPTVVVCVGTPLDRGTPNLSQLQAAVGDIAERITADTLVIVRSTVEVGTCRSVVLPALAVRVARPLLAYCPERTIQGQALAELPHLPQVVGGLDEPSTRRAVSFWSTLVDRTVDVSSLEAAELVKLVNNAHTDVYYAFGNEVALIAEALQLDAHEVIAAANVDYPRPDLARPGYVGGSCLTKDPWLLHRSARQGGYTPPLVTAARELNESLPAYVVERLSQAFEARGLPLPDAQILICGMAYKGTPPTDDMRGSAGPLVARRLVELGAAVRVHDFVVPPHLVDLPDVEIVPLAEGLKGAHAAVFLTDHPGYRSLDDRMLHEQMAPDPVIFDMWGVVDAAVDHDGSSSYLRFGRG